MYSHVKCDGFCLTAAKIYNFLFLKVFEQQQQNFEEYEYARSMVQRDTPP